MVVPGTDIASRGYYSSHEKTGCHKFSKKRHYFSHGTRTYNMPGLLYVIEVVTENKHSFHIAGIRTNRTKASDMLSQVL